MRRSHVDAISSLEQANPLEDALRWWTPSEEDALLESVLAENPEASASDVSSVLSGPPRQLTRRGIDRPRRARCRSGDARSGSGRIGFTECLRRLDGDDDDTPSLATGRLHIGLPTSVRVDTRHLGPTRRRRRFPSSLPPLVLTDSRGPFEMLVFSGPTGDGMCLWDSSKVLALTGSNGESLPATSDDAIGVPGVGFDRVGGSSVLTYADGHAGAHVTGVTLDLANGVRVEATVQNGFYAAWWPSQSDVTAAEVTSSEGPGHQDFGDIGPNNPSSSGIQP